MKKILVTGGLGFIGSLLVERLLHDGHSVTVVDVRRPTEPTLNFTMESKDVRTFIRELEAEERLVHLYQPEAPFDLIFHLAGSTGIGLGRREPEAMLRNNVDSVIDLLSYCRHNGHTKLIVASAGGIDHGLDFYSTSKLIAERLVRAFAEEGGARACAVRLFEVYGFGEPDRGPDSSFIRTCKDAARRNLPIIVRGDPDAPIDFVHVSDVVDGLVEVAAELEAGVGELLYELGAGAEAVSAKYAATAFAEDGVTVHFEPGHFAPPPRSDPSRWPLKWEPVVSVLAYADSWRRCGRPSD